MNANAEQLSPDELLHILSFSGNATAIYTTENLIIQSANDAALAIWGKDKQVIGKPLLEAIPELQGQPIEAMLLSVLRTGITDSSIISAETKMDKRLQTRYYEYECKAIKNSYGIPYAILNTGMDVTERVLGKQAIDTVEEYKEATCREKILNKELAAANENLIQSHDYLLTLNQQLTESEEHFRSMAESSGIFISVGNETNEATYFNKQWTDFTGRPMNDLLQLGWLDLIHPDDRQNYLDTYIVTSNYKNPFTGEFRLLNSKGNYCWMLAKCHPRFLADGSFAGYISSCIDITEQKEEAQRKDAFIAMVSHELRTPITSLTTYLYLLQEKMHTDEIALANNALQMAKNQVTKMNRLIHGFLTVGRLEAGKLELQKQDFFLDYLIKETISEISYIPAPHVITLLPGKPVYIYADRNKIGNVISNLLSNAIKFSPNGKSIQVQCHAFTDNIQVSIKDDGIGILSEHLDNLFERYYRIENHLNISGFGIGLYLCAEIIHGHNGKIWVESEVGKGATFYFSLPISEQTSFISGL